MKTLGNFIVILFFFAFNTVQAESLEVVAPEYPPFSSAKKIPGKGYGLAQDVFKAAFKAAGIDAKISVVPMKRAVYSFSQRKFNFNIMGKSFLTRQGLPEDKLSMVHTASNKASFFYYKKNHGGKEIKWNTLNDLKPYRIGVILGSPSENVLKKAGLNVEATVSAISLIKKLYLGRNDLWINLEGPARFLALQYHLESYSDFSQTKPLYVLESGLTYWNDNPKNRELAEKFKQGYRILVDKGEYHKINKRYWGDHIPAVFSDTTMKKTMSSW